MGRLSDDTASSGGKMRIGEQRTLTARDKETREIIKTYTLTRTDREYIYDLCDAYNDGRTEDQKHSGIEWFITSTKALALGFCQPWADYHTNQMKRAAEGERQRWIAGQAERKHLQQPA